MSMLIHSGLKILAREGYEILIDQGIEKAKLFADMITRESDFELVTEPELNILTYRYCPDIVQEALAVADELQAEKMNSCLNRITQREHGKAFVSRTRLEPARYYRFPCIVFRVVLANPLTTPEILEDILKEQKELSNSEDIADEIDILYQMANAVLKPAQAKIR
jgi:glutamate decarboxylase